MSCRIPTGAVWIAKRTSIIGRPHSGSNTLLGTDQVTLTSVKEKGREIEIALGNKFTVTPQVKGAIKAIPGVLDVQDL